MADGVLCLLHDWNADGSMSHVYRVRIPDLDTGVLLKLRGKLYVQAHTTELPGGGWTAFFVEQRGVIDLPDEEPE